jgi:hypothetical protein
MTSAGEGTYLRTAVPFVDCAVSELASTASRFGKLGHSDPPIRGVGYVGRHVVPGLTCMANQLGRKEILGWLTQ